MPAAAIELRRAEAARSCAAGVCAPEPARFAYPPSTRLEAAHAALRESLGASGQQVLGWRSTGSGKHGVAEGTLWLWDLIMTDLRWLTAMDMADWPLFATLAHVAAALGKLGPVDEPDAVDARFRAVVRAALRSGELLHFDVLVSAVERGACTVEGIASYVGMAEHLSRSEQDGLVVRVETCFRQRNLDARFADALLASAEVWSMLVRLGCRRAGTLETCPLPDL